LISLSLSIQLEKYLNLKFLSLSRRFDSYQNIFKNDLILENIIGKSVYND